MNAQESINAYWNQRAHTYHRLQQRDSRRQVDFEFWSGLLAETLPAGKQKVLDIGTGSGFLALVQARLGKQVTGIDLSEQMLELARHEAAQLEEAARPDFLLADAVDPQQSLGSQTFEVITSRYLMWTLRSPVQALENWRRLLVPGGRLVAVDAPWFPQGLDENKTENFATLYDESVRAELPLAKASSISGVVEAISGAGFEDVTVRELSELHALDLSLGATPGHEPTLQYMVTARAPETELKQN